MATVPQPQSQITKVPVPLPDPPPPQTSTVIDIKKDKEEPKNTVKYYVKFSFTLTYILLLTTATITFIEALRTKSNTVRHIMNLETCISIVAGYFYSIFVAQLDKYSIEKKEIDWSEISKTRYIDWAITTPMMLTVLCLVLAREIRKPIHAGILLLIVFLNYVMLYMGYLGEVIPNLKNMYLTFGFGAFAAMFGLIYYIFIRPKATSANLLLYMMYFIVWSLYGVVYMFSESVKNITMNILDMIAKCLIGLGLWVYYTGIVKL
jgi:bacteriorhodopsin